MALFRRNDSGSEAVTPVQTTPEQGGPPKKDRPTPTRREAEALRRQRVKPALSKREARQVTSRAARSERLKRVQERESAPEKVLMRDYIDSRFSLGEFLLPCLGLIFVSSLLGSVWPQVTVLGIALMYLYILLVLVDYLLVWRGFKKVLAKRLPRASSKGMFLYGFNRTIQLRRLRMPPPRLKRGATY